MHTLKKLMSLGVVRRTFVNLKPLGTGFSRTSTNIRLFSSNALERPRYTAISAKVTSELPDVKHWELFDESHMHSRGLESHFKLIIVSDTFQGKTHVARHRLVNKLLAEELRAGIHALSLLLYTTEEWEKVHRVPTSPGCAGNH
mgnify:CR=1 FL=1